MDNANTTRVCIEHNVSQKSLLALQLLLWSKKCHVTDYKHIKRLLNAPSLKSKTCN